MKIAFIFTDEFDLAQVPAGGSFRSNFEVPDAAKSLPDIETQVIAIGKLVAQFTNVSLHISCPDIGLKNHPIKQVNRPPNSPESLLNNLRATCLYFVGSFQDAYSSNRQDKRILKIYSPVLISFPSYGPHDRGYRDLRAGGNDPVLVAYTERVRILSERLLDLLNIDGSWRFGGFHPWEKQRSLITRAKNLRRKWRADERKQAREEEKRKAREAKLAEKIAAAPPADPLTHGAGRTVGARPGIYKGIQMRSQLEIRFAAELDERGIRWVYEGEALSASSYLVDFYLPDLGVWVEVKGKFEARDRQVLPEVAQYLKAERKHRLLVYTSSGKCFVVNPSGFREVERRNFFGELVR